MGGWRGKGRLIPKPSPRFFNTISLYNSFSKMSIFGNLGGGGASEAPRVRILREKRAWLLRGRPESDSVRLAKAFGRFEAAPRASLCDSQRHLGVSRPI